MKTVCVTLLAFLLLALLLSSQVVLAQDNTNITTTPGPNTNMTSTVSVNSTSGDKNGAERTGGLALLLPVALGATLLHGWSQ